MTTGEFALVVTTVLCAIGFAALIVVLLRVLDTLRALRGEVESLRNETKPLLAERNDHSRPDHHGVAERIRDEVRERLEERERQRDLDQRFA